jgi:Mrp family chromosome partitioning ATPase
MAQVQEVAALPTIARRAQRPIAVVEPEVVDACRLAWANLGGPTAQSLAVTSSVRGEGRTTVALGLALAQWREYGRRAIVVEVDFESPMLAHLVGANQTPGLAEFVQGQVPFGAIVQPMFDGLTVIAAGSASGPPSLLLMEVLRRRPLQDLGGWDIVIADLPPILVSGFARLSLSDFERTVIVVRAGVTQLRQLREATAGFPAETPLLLNDAESGLPRWLRRLTGS